MAHLIHNVLPTPRREIAYITFNDSVRNCVKKMAALEIGALVVVDDDHQFMGIVSERDLVRAAVNKNIHLESASVSEVYFPDVTILSPHDAVEKAMQAMIDTKRRHVLIKDKGEFIAIISIGDLLYHLLEDKSRQIEHLEQYIHN